MWQDELQARALLSHTCSGRRCTKHKTLAAAGRCCRCITEDKAAACCARCRRWGRFGTGPKAACTRAKPAAARCAEPSSAAKARTHPKAAASACWCCS